jgi:hypothetical protein
MGPIFSEFLVPFDGPARLAHFVGGAEMKGDNVLGLRRPPPDPVIE